MTNAYIRQLPDQRHLFVRSDNGALLALDDPAFLNEAERRGALRVLTGIHSASTFILLFGDTT